MTRQELVDLIDQGESQTLEFKVKPDPEIGKSFVAFANSNDGIVIVGVSDDKKIKGCSSKDELSIANTAHNCKPSIYPEIEKIKIEGKPVFVVKVKKSGSGIDYAYKNTVYRRVGTHDEPMSPKEVVDFAKDSGILRFDSKVCKEASLKNIDKEKVRWFLKEARVQRGLDIQEETSINEALIRLKLIKDKKLTNAAILLFVKDPHAFFSRPELKCIRFKGIDVAGEMTDFKIKKGSLFDQLIETEHFIYNNIAMAAWVEDGKLQRQEKWEYPPKAIREVLVNALCHREYETTTSAQVRIFDDRIEFWNPGRLPGGWTIETLKHKHESIPPNPMLLQHFFWVKYAEEVGTGTNKVIDWCQEWGLPEPDFDFTGTSIVVTFWKSKLSEEYLKTLHLNDRQIKAIEHLRLYKKITASEYQKLTRISKTPAYTELNDMLSKGIIKRIGKGRTTYYVPQESFFLRTKKERKKNEKI